METYFLNVMESDIDSKILHPYTGFAAPDLEAAL